MIDKDDSYSIFWMEGDLWYGYGYDDRKKRFVFDDIGNRSFVDLVNQIWEGGNQ
jgi:hypothetical protein